MADINDFFKVISASGYASFDGYNEFAESVDSTFKRSMSVYFAERYLELALTFLKSNARGPFQMESSMQFDYLMDFPYLKTAYFNNPTWMCLANCYKKDATLFNQLLNKKMNYWKELDVINLLSEAEPLRVSAETLKSLLVDNLKKYGFDKVNKDEWLYKAGMVSMILRPNLNVSSKIAPFNFNIRYASKVPSVYFILENVVPGLQAYKVHKDFYECSLYISSRLLIGTLVTKYLNEKLATECEQL